MNEWIEWMEQQVREYELYSRNAEHYAKLIDNDLPYGKQWEESRAAVYANVASDLRAKLIQLKAKTA